LFNLLEIKQLRSILESVQAKNKERTWVKQRLQGELDDNKLVDGIAGDQNIYKMRGKEDPMQGMRSLCHFFIRIVLISRWVSGEAEANGLCDGCEWLNGQIQWSRWTLGSFAAMHYHGMMHLVLFISLTLQDYGSVGWL
jgi:hypothetical protein